MTIQETPYLTSTYFLIGRARTSRDGEVWAVVSHVWPASLEVVGKFSHDIVEDGTADDVTLCHGLIGGGASAEGSSEELVKGPHAVKLEQLIRMEETDGQSKVTFHTPSLGHNKSENSTLLLLLLLLLLSLAQHFTHASIYSVAALCHGKGWLLED